MKEDWVPFFIMTFACFILMVFGYITCLIATMTGDILGMAALICISIVLSWGFRPQR